MCSSLILRTCLCILATLCLVKCNISSPTNDENSFESICTKKCQNSEDRSEVDDVSLHLCSCSPSCSTYGDCCFDSNYKNMTSSLKKDFICLSVFGRGRYLAVSGCPTDQVSDHCKAAIGHLPPVTSKVTNTTYANVFCAVCNEDAEKLETWKVELRCSPDQTGEDASSSASDSIEIIYHFGYLWKYTRSTKSRNLCMYHVHFADFNRIDSLELRHCGQEKKVHECSPSWTNSDTINMCRSYEDPIYFGSKVYRNSHCAACNYVSLRHAKCMPGFMEEIMSQGVVDAEVMTLCRQRGSSWCLQFLFSGGKGQPYSFSSLLNIHQRECVPKEGQRCCSGERYDFYSKRCRKLVRT